MQKRMERRGFLRKCHASCRIKFDPGNFEKSRFSDRWNFFSDFQVLGILSRNVMVIPVISWNGYNHFQRIFPSNSRHLTSLQPRGLILSSFFYGKSRANVCKKNWLTKNCSGEFMIPLHSPRKEYSKTEFGRRIPRKSSENQKLFPGANLVLRPA